MTPFRRILFPIDFSQATVAMVPSVTEMAHRFNASVTVLNAFNLAPDYVLAPRLANTCDSEPAAIPYTPPFQELRRQAEKRLREFSRTQLSSVTQSARLEDGDPAMVIEWVARREEIDLIMMPTKGFGRFRRLLLGSVTAKALHDVSCPVLTSAHEPDPAPGTPGGYGSIVCAVELDSEAQDVRAAAGLLAQVYAARICLVHIEPPSHESDGQPPAQLVRQAFAEAVNIGGPEAGVDTTVRVRDAWIPEAFDEPRLKKRRTWLSWGEDIRKDIFRAFGRIFTGSFANHRARF